MLPFFAVATPTPTPTDFDPNLVTPGVIGFVVTLALIVGTIFLIIDMNRRTRRVTYRAQIAERLDAEEAVESGAGDEPDAGDASEGDDAK